MLTSILHLNPTHKSSTIPPCPSENKFALLHFKARPHYTSTARTVLEGLFCFHEPGNQDQATVLDVSVIFRWLTKRREPFQPPGKRTTLTFMLVVLTGAVESVTDELKWLSGHPQPLQTIHIAVTEICLHELRSVFERLLQQS